MKRVVGQRASQSDRNCHYENVNGLAEYNWRGPSPGMTSRRNGDARSTQSITKADLVRLLARLTADEERAAREYERLRRTPIKFFDERGVCPPDECADQTLDRLARKLQAT